MTIQFNPYYNSGVSGTRYGCTDSNGNLWTNNGSTQIYVTSPSGVLLKTITPSQNLQTPQLAADKNGHVYACVYHGAGIQWAMYDVTGAETLIVQTSPGYNNGKVNGWGNDGSNIYFLNNNLYAFNFTTQVTTQINAGSFGSNTDLAVVWHSPTNTIWAHDVEGGHVYVFSITGTLLQTITVQSAIGSSSRKIMIASDADSNLVWLIWDTGGGGSMRLASINPFTYAITDKTSLISGYNPACMSSFSTIYDGSYGYAPGVWITTYDVAPNGSRYILMISNGVVSSYIPVYESHLESVDSGIVLLTFYPITRNNQHLLLSTIYIPCGSGCYIAGGVIVLKSATVPVESEISTFNVSNNSAVIFSKIDSPPIPVMGKGICYNKIGFPTTADLYTNDGLGPGSFVSNINNLISNTTYYARPYITTAYGTTYGNQITFKTISNIQFTDVSTIWNSMSDAWSTLDGKDVIENIWATTYSGVSMLMQQMMDVQNSRSFEYMPRTLNSGPASYTFIYSGQNSQINVLAPTGSELFRYYIDPWTISIPSMTQTYLYYGTKITNTFIEGVDYVISGMNTLLWLTTPSWDQRYSGLEVITVIAPLVVSVNSVLMNSWGRMVNVDLNVFNSYNTFGNDQYLHLKYFIWGLGYKGMQSPTIKTLQDGLSIARGFPFAYNSGTLTYVSSGNQYLATVGADKYQIPNTLPMLPQGSVISQFDILTSGIKVDDYYSNPSLFNTLAKFNTIAIELTSGDTLPYNAELFSNVCEMILPIQYFKNYIGF